MYYVTKNNVEISYIGQSGSLTLIDLRNPVALVQTRKTTGRIDGLSGILLAISINCIFDE